MTDRKTIRLFSGIFQQLARMVRTLRPVLPILCLLAGGTSLSFARRNAPVGPMIGSERVLDLRSQYTSDLNVLVTNYNGLGFFEFPYGSRLGYLYGAKVIFGCVRGVDTLVSECGALPPVGALTWEMHSYAQMHETSSVEGRASFSPVARAEQEIFMVASDTSIIGSGLDEIELRPHKPIGIEVHRTTYTWTGPLLRRFVLLDYWIRNISGQTISNGCIGFVVSPNVHFLREGIPVTTWPPWGITGYELPPDDLTGFLKTWPGITEDFTDTIETAWFADNDGDPEAAAAAFTNHSPTGVMGIRVVRPANRRLSYNWWVYRLDENFNDLYDWGPRWRPNNAGYHHSLGTPYGDRARYKMMVNGEIDYDQIFSASADPPQQGWCDPLPPEFAQDVADGGWVTSLLSVGPLQPILPGDSVALTVALVAGEGFHRSSGDFRDYMDYRDPAPFLSRLDFTDLAQNARWADWVFDTPGYDTDGDGNRGRYYLTNCAGGNCDTIFYKGDGVADFRSPQSPPPAPAFRAETGPGWVTLSWRGARSELTRDPWSGRRDFEGYRVYAGRFNTNDAYALIANWDVVDYSRFAFDPEKNDWRRISDPKTPEAWREILYDPAFDPEDYSAPSLAQAYRDTVQDTTIGRYGDTTVVDRERLSYWERGDYNRANDYIENGQREWNLIQRTEERDTIINSEPLKYGCYEVTLDNLNPTVPLYFTVSAFDFGNYEYEIGPAASSLPGNGRYAEPIYSSDVVADSNLRVVVYPNPYKASYSDASGRPTTYYQEGYEGRGKSEFAEQDRRIHFINLPDSAAISIYTLDGDLIRRIDHPDRFLTTYAPSVAWDLISRNGQSVVSGIYIWRVDSRLGTQTGKLVIIK